MTKDIGTVIGVIFTLFVVIVIEFTFHPIEFSLISTIPSLGYQALMYTVVTLLSAITIVSVARGLLKK